MANNIFKETLSKLNIDHYLDENRFGAICSTLPAAEAARRILTDPEHTPLFAAIAIGSTLMAAKFISEIIKIYKYVNEYNQNNPL